MAPPLRPLQRRCGRAACAGPAQDEPARPSQLWCGRRPVAALAAMEAALQQLEPRPEAPPPR